MSFEFFFSYARANNDAYLAQFLEDLTTEVCVALGIRTNPDIRFFDQQDIELGNEWDPNICEALQSSKALVCLYSPAYFSRPYCGKEWAIFQLRRREAAKAGEKLPPVILPVLWVPPIVDDSREPKAPPLPDTIDSAVSAIQYTYGDERAAHNIKGLRHILMRKQEHLTEYTDYVQELAQRIVLVGKRHPLPSLLNIPALHQVAPAFPTSTTTPLSPKIVTAQPASSGPRYVRFVVVAADPNTFGNAREPEPYLETGGDDWRPFYPLQPQEIGPYVQGVASRADPHFRSDILPFRKTLRSDIEEAWKDRKIVVLLVDGWTIFWDAESRRILEEVTKMEEFRNCTVLIPWNESDPGIAAHRDDIERLLRRTFQSRWSMGSVYYRDSIRSLEELEATLRDVLIRIKAEIRNKTEPARPVPSVGPAPIVSASGGHT
jgi:FxsC-like protein